MPESNPIDVQIAKIRKGDLDAYTEIVRATQDSLRAHILWLCPQSNVVDDIAQDVYIYAYQNLDKYETGTNLLAWLKKIAHFRVLTHVRTLSAQAHREQRYFDEFLFEAMLSDDVPEAQERRVAYLRECLARLPAKSMELIVNRYENNLDSKRLAKLFHKSPEAIRITLLRIRELLRSCLNDKMSLEGVLS